MSTLEKLRRAAGLLMVALILTVCATEQFRAFISFPDHVRLQQGVVQNLALKLPLGGTVRPDRGGALALNGVRLEAEGRHIALGAPFSIAALSTGQFSMDFRLFGLIPLRKLKVDVVPPMRVIPGGHSIGVLLKSRGVIVVGHAAVRDEQGTLRHPGKDGGLELGDAILSIGGRDVTSDEQAARLFDEAGQSGGEVSLTIKRKGRILQKAVSPIREEKTGRYRVGLYIRDGAAGIGTLTFYDPVTGKYGALGHVIADAETAQPIDVDKGHIVEAEVSAIQPGRKSAPGEKIGNMVNQDDWLGSIEKNTRFGIFGTMSGPIRNPYYQEPIPVAMAAQVKEGPAEILTVVSGQKLERYTVEIQRVMKQPTAEGKNMIVKVTDPRLLEKTGGIVQGMSGSPILQDGKIIGAVTHVFVNDPTRGYGVLIEWMLQEAGVLVPSKGTSSGWQNPPGLLRASAGAAKEVLLCNEPVTDDMLLSR